MNNRINWSSAPEGTQAVNITPIDSKIRWYKEDEKEGQFYHTPAGWVRSLITCSIDDTIHFIKRPTTSLVYTQEMYDAGEDPIVGMECSLSFTFNQEDKNIVTVLYMSKKYCIASKEGLEQQYYREYMTFKPIITKIDKELVQEAIYKIINDGTVDNTQKANIITDIVCERTYSHYDPIFNKVHFTGSK